MSFISHKPIAGDFGAIALLVGSYQFLQNAHLFMLLIFTTSDDIFPFPVNAKKLAGHIHVPLKILNNFIGIVVYDSIITQTNPQFNKSAQINLYKIKGYSPGCL